MDNSAVSQSDMTYFWKKREIVTYILSILVLLVHVSTFSNYPGNGSTISVINESVRIIVTECFTRFAVPLYFILSGTLFFRNYSWDCYGKKLKQRARTLLIPYLLWNTLWMLFSIAISYSFVSNYFIGRQKFVISWESILKAIFFYDCNKPFWFLFNLMVFIAISPLIDLVIRNKYIGLAAAAALPVLGALGIEIPESIFYYPQSITFYLIGCMIGRYGFGTFCKKADRKRQILGAVFLPVMAVYLYLLKTGVFMVSVYEINDMLFVLCALAFWDAADLFVEKLKPLHCYKTSFAVYAMHTNVLAIITKLLYLALPKHPLFAIPNLILTVILTLVSINLFCIVLEKLSPRLYRILMGNR